MTESTDLRLRYKQSEGDILVDGIIAEINESISQIIETKPGTRLFNRSFGSGINNILFELISDHNAALLLILLEQAVDTFEPRVSLLFNFSEVIPDYINNGYNIRIVYNIIGREDTGEFNTFLQSQTG